MEKETRTIPMDEKYEATLKQWADDGWGLVPNTKPMVTLEICRALRDITGARVTLNIDDEKVWIIRADGTQVKA